MVCTLIFLVIFVVPPAIRADATVIYVDPPLQVRLSAGEIFRVNVTVAKVTNLYAWEFGLCYKSEVLNASDWSPGSVFASSGLLVKAVEFTDNYNETHGLIHIICTFFGSIQAFNGTTTLATIEFKVKSVGTTVLHLQNTSLLDNSDPWPYPITHTTSDGLITDQSIPGDVNADGQVNIIDLNIVARAFGSKLGDQGWNPIADLDNNGVINIIDIARVAKEYSSA
jgi:hypothetical protein